MSNAFWLYNMRGLFVCLGFLIGIGGGGFLLLRKKIGAGVLAILGFALLSVEPITGFITRQALSNQLGIDAPVLFSVTGCLTGTTTFFGSIALVGALLLALRPQTPAEDLL